MPQPKRRSVERKGFRGMDDDDDDDEGAGVDVDAVMEAAAAAAEALPRLDTEV